MIRYYLTFLCVCKLIFASGETTLFRQRRGTGLSTLSTNPQPNQTSIEHIDAVLVHRLWPPWPFNTLEITDSNQKRKKSLTLPIIKTRTFLLWAYLRERAKIGTLQLQQGPCNIIQKIKAMSKHVQYSLQLTILSIN